MHKKQMPFWRSPATSRPRCQGRVGFAFTGVQRTPLTEEASDLGAVFPQEGRAGRKTVPSEIYRAAYGLCDLCGLARTLVGSPSDTYTTPTRHWET